MKARRLIALLAVSIVLALGAVGCGSSNGSGARPHHHAVAKGVVGAVIIHHLVKKHGGHHALAKAVAGGVIIHHVVKKHGRR
jgi:hypothetical protein